MITKHLVYFLPITLMLFGSMALANDDAPCKSIKAACQGAGFVDEEAKVGKGLWKDCVDPILRQTKRPKSVLPLPTIDPKVIADCKLKHSNYGSGNEGN